MTTKTVSFTLKDLSGQPLSNAVTGYFVWFTDANGVAMPHQDVSAGGSASFDLADGDWVAHVHAHAADGSLVGDEALSAVTSIVTPQTLVVLVPDQVTVS